MREKRIKKKRMNIWLKIILTLFSILILIFAAGIFTFYRTLGKIEQVSVDTSDLSINYEEIEEFENHEEIINIALFGIDSTEGITGRSDAIMVATIDPIHNKLKLTSIMRDSYVNIPDRGMDKINHAYAFGGPQLAIKTINENYGSRVLIQEFAKKFNLNPNYLSSLFKSVCGKSFTSYLTELRLKKAKELLKDSSLSLYEISDRVGYDDYFHFSKIFKKYNGLSPGNFRKKTAESNENT